MRITVSSGRTYQIQFVHSSHNFQPAVDKPVNPGGLRQFIDNLALSLNRRVSFAEISEVRQTGGADGSVDMKFTPLAQGFAICHHKDQFNKAEGRARAVARAIHNAGVVPGAGLTLGDADEIVSELGYVDVCSLFDAYL